MSYELKGLMPKRRRSKLGPTRYVPRCKCGAALPIRYGEQQHCGPCEPCREAVLMALKGYQFIIDRVMQS